MIEFTSQSMASVTNEIRRSSYEDMINEAEIIMDRMERVDPPTTHHFIPGFYIRQITMPAGFMCTTKTHGRRHAFTISKGRVWVKCDDEEAVLFEGPYTGITEPGTRRILICETEVVWTTMHQTEQLDTVTLVSSIEQEIMLPTEHPVPIADSLNRQINGHSAIPALP